jgi:hypothetical protein
MTRCVVADFKHGLALWAGSGDEASKHFDLLRSECDRYGAGDEFRRLFRILEEGRDVDGAEMDQMERTLHIPRRVVLRFEKGVFDEHESGG